MMILLVYVRGITIATAISEHFLPLPLTIRIHFYTVCPGSSDPFFFIVSCYIKWVTTSRTYNVCPGSSDPFYTVCPGSSDPT